MGWPRLNSLGRERRFEREKPRLAPFARSYVGTQHTHASIGANSRRRDSGNSLSLSLSTFRERESRVTRTTARDAASRDGIDLGYFRVECARVDKTMSGGEDESNGSPVAFQNTIHRPNRPEHDRDTRYEYMEKTPPRLARAWRRGTGPRPSRRLNTREIEASFDDVYLPWISVSFERERERSFLTTRSVFFFLGGDERRDSAVPRRRRSPRRPCTRRPRCGGLSRALGEGKSRSTQRFVSALSLSLSLAGVVSLSREPRLVSRL